MRGANAEIPKEFMDGLIFMTSVLGQTLLSLDLSNNFMGIVVFDQIIDEVLLKLPKLEKLDMS